MNNESELLLTIVHQAMQLRTHSEMIARLQLTLDNMQQSNKIADGASDSDRDELAKEVNRLTQENCRLTGKIVELTQEQQREKFDSIVWPAPSGPAYQNLLDEIKRLQTVVQELESESGEINTLREENKRRYEAEMRQANEVKRLQTIVQDKETAIESLVAENKRWATEIQQSDEVDRLSFALKMSEAKLAMTLKELVAFKCPKPQLPQFLPDEERAKNSLAK